MSNRKNASIIGHPQFKTWVRTFNFNDPKFLASVDQRNRASERWISDLRKKEKIIEAQMNWDIPIKNNERTRT